MKVEKPRQIYRLSGFQRQRGRGIKRNERCSSQLQSDVLLPPSSDEDGPLSVFRCVLRFLRFDISFSFDSIRLSLLVQ